MALASRKTTHVYGLRMELVCVEMGLFLPFRDFLRGRMAVGASFRVPQVFDNKNRIRWYKRTGRVVGKMIFLGLESTFYAPC